MALGTAAGGGDAGGSGDRPRRRDRRRRDRRSDWVALGDYPVPELRKAVVTIVLLLAVLLLFLYMVHDVLIAVVAGVVLAVYMVPFQQWIERALGTRRGSSVLAIVVVTVPLVAILVYSWLEISGAAQYLGENRREVAEAINRALQRLPFAEGIYVEDRISELVGRAAEGTANIVGELQETLDIIVLSVAVLLFTVYYLLTDGGRLTAYVDQRIPGRYRDLSGVIAKNVRAVVYGALYATFLTQVAKSTLVLAMNLAFDVPLAWVLAIVSFFIGFFPIVGSWSVYVPVAVYLFAFRDDVLGAVLMVLIGFVANTMILSMYLRPKIAAQKSQVLNFYWMFIALVTGVYTFGLVGIIIGPVLIAVLKAVLDSVTGDAPRIVGPPRSRRRPTPEAPAAGRSSAGPAG